MITLHFSILDKKANTLCHGIATPLHHSDKYEFKMIRNFVDVSSCTLSLDAFVQGQSEQGFCVSFAPSEYFFLD